MKDFKIAEIVPSSQLEDTAKNYYHMCNAHYIVGDGRMECKYKNFYKRMSSHDKYVIMGNFYVGGKQLGFRDYIDMYDKIHPAEMVIPYTQEDMNDTLAKFFDWIKYTELPCKLMAVPQGRDFEEWKTCAYVMMCETRINTIGIPKNLNIVTNNEYARYDAALYLEEIADKLKRKDVEYHLLGCNERLAVIREMINVCHKIRGCSSSLAYVTSKEEIVIEANTKRPDESIDILYDRPLDGYNLNAHDFELICGVRNNTSSEGWVNA